MSKLVPFATRIPAEVLDWIESEAVTFHMTPSARGKEVLEKAFAERACNRGNLTQKARGEPRDGRAGTCLGDREGNLRQVVPRKGGV